MTDQLTSKRSTGWLRLVAVAILIAAAAYSLPLSAATVEAVSSWAENWIFVVQIVVMLGLGAALGALAPALSPATALSRRVPTWAGIALLATLVGDVVWFFLISG